MNNNARDDANKKPVPLKNQATPDSIVFASATTAHTSGAAADGIASTIVSHAHIPPSGQK